MSYQPKADEIKALREETSAPMMDCRKALVEAAGDVGARKALLQERGAAQAEKKAERAANEGLVASYIHAGGKIGVLVEVNSETDFVARNPKFAELSRDIAMHVAAMSPQYLDRESVPSDVVDGLRAEFAATVPAGKPPEVAEKIVEGKLNKWYEEHCCSTRRSSKTTRSASATSSTARSDALGEKIRVRRFTKLRARR